VYPRHLTEYQVILNNFFGRQFNSIDDVAINPRNQEIYFTDPTYGYVQSFRPPPGLQKQVYRFNLDTGAVGIAADGFNEPNGETAHHGLHLKWKNMC
jgi:gluconolactonase